MCIFRHTTTRETDSRTEASHQYRACGVRYRHTVKITLLFCVHLYLLDKYLLCEFRDNFVYGNITKLCSQSVSTLSHRTIHFLGSLLWNALPPDLKELSNTKIFKQKLKIFLLSQ